MPKRTKHERHERDYYITPPDIAEAAVRQGLEWCRRVQKYTQKGSFLEPGCGELAPFADVACDFFGDVTAVDIMEKPNTFKYDGDGIDQRFECDFLEPWEDKDKKYDLIAGNPPFRLAEEFLRKGLTLLKPDGVLVFLLRLCFLASIKRVPLFKKYPPLHVSVLAKRPSFTGDGGTDGQDYAFFTWRKPLDPQSIQFCTIGWFNNSGRYQNICDLTDGKDM